jgi:beta-glucosidase
MTNEAMEARIDQLLLEMTVDEKVALCHGSSGFASGGVSRLGVPPLKMSDGPHGVGPAWRDGGGEAELADVDDHMTALPTGICLAATWDEALARRYGEVLGAESRARGKDMILGPGINVRRTPLCGRNFEYMGEDPFLISRMACGYVRGVQSQGVACCAKHYACNNQELGRTTVDVQVDERTLRELYLYAFEAVVKEAGIHSIMAAYNHLRGQDCCHHDYLLNAVLKREWGFEGVVVSDFGGVRDTFEAVTGGVDIVMGNAMLTTPYLEGVKAGHYSMAELDDKARRSLRVLGRIGVLAGDPARPAGAKTTPEHIALARKVAAEGIVLLKNEGGRLPFKTDGIRRLAVIGENADARLCHSGGSSAVMPLHEVTPLEALRERYGNELEIVYEPGYPDLDAEMQPIPSEFLGCTGERGGLQGWTLTWHNTRGGAFAGDAPIHEDVVPTVHCITDKPLREDCLPHRYAVTWTTILTPPETGVYEFVMQGSDCGFRVFGEYRMGSWDNDGIPTVTSCRLELAAGKPVELRVMTLPGPSGVHVRFGWRPPGAAQFEQGERFAAAVDAARRADAVIFVGGLTHGVENEGMDLLDMTLPLRQDELIEALADANPELCVVLAGGGGTAMPWLDRVPALVQLWYGGMEAGHALVDVLSGAVNPCGRLPVTMPRRLEDVGAHTLGDYDDKRTVYREGVFVGYRWADEYDVEPLFPFGFGLSYTQFSYSNMKIETAGAEKAFEGTVRVDVENAGERAGADVVQLYVGDDVCSVRRPPRELKGFQKVYLEPGERRSLTFKLNWRSLAFVHPLTRTWTVEPGAFTVWIGRSSRDLVAEQRFTLGTG